MKSLIALFASLVLLMAPVAANADSAALDRMLWKNRIILIKDGPMTDQYVEAFQSQKSWIDDRDIIWVIVDTDRPTVVASNYEGTLPQSLAIQASSAEFLGSQNSHTVLIGKDGGVKDRAEQLDLNRIFGLIDSMPMRRREVSQSAG